MIVVSFISQLDLIPNAFFDGDCRYNSFLFTGKVSGLPCHCIEL